MLKMYLLFIMLFARAILSSASCNDDEILHTDSSGNQLCVKIVAQVLGKLQPKTCGLDSTNLWANIATQTNEMFYMNTVDWTAQNVNVDQNLYVGKDIVSQGTLHIYGGAYDEPFTDMSPFRNSVYFGNKYITENGDSVSVSLSGGSEMKHEQDLTQIRPKISLFSEYSIFAQDLIASSDKRIKKDIESIPDSLSLDILRKLDAKYYNYKDVVSRGVNRTIGFIAQDVREVIPEAVKLIKNFIPNHMSFVEIDWVVSENDVKMKLTNEVEPGKYRFYLANNQTGEKMYELETEDGSTFLVDSRDYVTEKAAFLYGSQVDDFHTIDKQKIFAVAYSALQEIDRKQQQLMKTVEAREQTLIDLESRLAELESDK